MFFGGGFPRGELRRPALGFGLRGFELRARLGDKGVELAPRESGGFGRGLGRGLWRGGDVAVIDGVMVNGSAKLVGLVSRITRFFQTGYIYHYAFTMIIGVFLLMTFWR